MGLQEAQAGRVCKERVRRQAGKRAPTWNELPAVAFVMHARKDFTDGAGTCYSREVK